MNAPPGYARGHEPRGFGQLSVLLGYARGHGPQRFGHVNVSGSVGQAYIPKYVGLDSETQTQTLETTNYLPDLVLRRAGYAASSPSSTLYPQNSRKTLRAKALELRKFIGR